MVGRALLRIPARNIAARSISAVMQPTVTIIPLLALFNGLHQPRVTLARWLIWSCATITCATTLPSILFLVMLKRGTIADLHVSNRSERPLAYAVMILSYVLGTEVARTVAAPHQTVLLMAAMTLCLMIGSAVNEFMFKFSIHTMSATLAVVALVFASSNSSAVPGGRLAGRVDDDVGPRRGSRPPGRPPRAVRGPPPRNPRGSAPWGGLETPRASAPRRLRRPPPSRRDGPGSRCPP